MYIQMPKQVKLSHENWREFMASASIWTQELLITVVMNIYNYEYQ